MATADLRKLLGLPAPVSGEVGPNVRPRPPISALQIPQFAAPFTSEEALAASGQSPGQPYDGLNRDKLRENFIGRIVDTAVSPVAQGVSDFFYPEGLVDTFYNIQGLEGPNEKVTRLQQEAEAMQAKLDARREELKREAKAAADKSRQGGGGRSFDMPSTPTFTPELAPLPGQDFSATDQAIGELQGLGTVPARSREERVSDFFGGLASGAAQASPVGVGAGAQTIAALGAGVSEAMINAREAQKEREHRGERLKVFAQRGAGELEQSKANIEQQREVANRDLQLQQLDRNYRDFWKAVEQGRPRTIPTPYGFLTTETDINTGKYRVKHEIDEAVIAQRNFESGVRQQAGTFTTPEGIEVPITAEQAFVSNIAAHELSPEQEGRARAFALQQLSEMRESDEMMELVLADPKIFLKILQDAEWQFRKKIVREELLSTKQTEE